MLKIHHMMRITFLFKTRLTAELKNNIIMSEQQKKSYFVLATVTVDVINHM